jgi:hypothetical protein
MCIMAAVFLVINILCSLFERLEWAPSKPAFVPLRGQGLVAVEQARERADSARASDPDTSPGEGVKFGPVKLPVSALNTHFLITGAPGSGKSVSLERMLDAALAAQARAANGNVRLLLYDPKNEWPSKAFARLPARASLYLANPLDDRGRRWDLAADFTSRADFLQLASMLVPEVTHDQNRFFTDSARDTVADVLLVLNHFANDAWTLRDLILFGRSPRRLRALLGLHVETRDRIEQVLKARSGKDVISTIGSHLAKFSPVAGCWHHASLGMSLKRFKDESGAILLGHHSSVSYALKHLNRLLVKRVCDLVLDRQSPSDRTIFAFDEFRLFGKSEGLIEVAMRGRSSGACLIVACQDINGLDATHDNKSARELCALLQNRIFLKAGSAEHARFASELLGRQEVKQYTTNSSVTTNTGASRPASRSETNSEQIVQRDAVLPTELTGLPLADPKLDRLAAFYQSPVTGSFYHEGPFVADLGRLPVASNVPDFIPRPASHQHLPRLTRADLVRLKLRMTRRLLAAL